ncbi:DUF934 domain-containing protein [Chelatococcus reniformis]|uniref:Oxidoreductase n=1 Tax=Chelatococcus reniformis TaxID=1494448 RepID=A0A916XDN9_9HYPH|nr:DUF934 domain-containing protein [Chelatococcus reniformis]GGC63009.1 oxidoreductase [Chelatococcus reniformis]
MTTLVKDGQVVDDPWIVPGDDERLPADRAALISKTRFLAELEGVSGRNAPLGLKLEAGEGLDGIEADLHRFALIVLSFPKYTDGRAYSLARLLRERHGFAGELRASGEVLRDQIPLMRRCGFDAFAISHAGTLKALLEGRIKDVDIHYQPAAIEAAEQTPLGARPWLRVAK